MAHTKTRTISDWTTIALGSIGIFLGVSGLIFPETQFDALGISSNSIDEIIPGLLGSAGLSATYMGIMYIFGTIKQWKGFKHYLIFARMLMAVGFVILVAIGRAPETYIMASVWEAVGAVLIFLALKLDNRKKNDKQLK